jgi:eukaryotic-like serine/threonine-protein kinase
VDETAPTPADPPGLSGQVVSHFRVREALGAGGMGVVYMAEDLQLQRTVALKFMLPGYITDETAAARFLREARAVAALDHTNICTIHEVGQTDDGQLFLAMSYYPGETLAGRLTSRGPLPISEALDVTSQIARGLARAHDAGIVHRDLKPANVMLTADGTVKILDFGLAKARDQTITVTGGVMGTVAYMSPEQLLGDPVDARSDLWSLGVTLFEMLTGQHPSRGDDIAGTLARKIEAQQTQTAQSDLTSALQHVVERLLRKDQDERYQSAAELLKDLTALRERMAVSAQPITAVPRAAERVAMRWRAALGGAAVVLASAIGVLWWSQSQRRNSEGSASASTPSAALSLAVLPLKNYSGSEQEYFADGMTEELTSTLTKIESLRVIAHQSVAQFKGSRQTVPEIARSLNVKYLVDGSIRLDTSRIRITASLIDAAKNAPVWSNSFDEDRRDVMKLQRDVALAIAQAIEVRLTPQDRSRLAPTEAVDREAFELYIKGTQARYAANFTGDYREATGYLSGAIAKDSAYAPAYAGLANVYAFLDDSMRAHALAEKALTLDPNLAEAHTVLGLVRQFFDWDWSGAENAFRQAIRLNPGYAEAHHELSMVLMRQKQFGDALREARLTVYLSPVAVRFANGVAEVQVFAGQPVQALAIADRLLAEDSTFAGAHYVRGMAYEQMGRYEEATKAWVTCIRLAPLGCDQAHARLGYIYGLTGRRAFAMRVVDTLKAHLRDAKARRVAGAIAVDVAIVYIGLGNKLEALNWLERAAEGHVQMLYLAVDPLYRSLYSEPRFRALLKKIGLPS